MKPIQYAYPRFQLYAQYHLGLCITLGSNWYFFLRHEGCAGFPLSLSICWQGKCTQSWGRGREIDVVCGNINDVTVILPRELQLKKLQRRSLKKFFNPLTLKSDQHLFSPYNISSESNNKNRGNDHHQKKDLDW